MFPERFELGRNGIFLFCRNQLIALNFLKSATYSWKGVSGKLERVLTGFGLGLEGSARYRLPP
jgi:hypothetical protein